MKIISAFLIIACLAGGHLFAEETNKSPVRLAAENTERLLTALRDGNRNQFIANSTPEFATAMSVEAFSEARQKLLPILSRPSQLDFLGSLNKDTAIVYLYRLRPEAKGVDSLVTTAITKGKVSGFFVN